MNPRPATNHRTITIVVVTVCILAGVCVVSEAICSLFKIPDMSGNISGSFTHVTDTLVGALLTMLVNTIPKAQNPPPAVTIGNDATITTPPQPPPATP